MIRKSRPSMQRCSRPHGRADRKSTRLNSSHTVISYAVFCLKKKHAVGTRKRRAVSASGWVVDVSHSVNLTRSKCVDQSHRRAGVNQERTEGCACHVPVRGDKRWRSRVECYIPFFF